jgi:hypothetical protein
MRYKVTLQSGEAHEFDSPFHVDSLRKSMNLPLSAKIEVVTKPGPEAQNGALDQNTQSDGK